MGDSSGMGMVHDFIAFPIAQAMPAQELVIQLLQKALAKQSA